MAQRKVLQVLTAKQITETVITSVYIQKAHLLSNDVMVNKIMELD